MTQAETATLSDQAWLRAPALARTLAVLNGRGEEARVVGGAVRNALMRLPLSDIDIATTASPDEVMRRAAAAGVKAVPTGIDHGTVTLVTDGHPFEVTTLRQDVETFGRKAKVAFGRDWKADAERRDFTINGLFVSRDGTVYDYVGGLADVRAKRVRFIGDPARRIAEDYLRILRFFRFQATYAVGAPDPDGLRACIAGREGLDGLSRERIRAELMKLLVAPFGVETVRVMAETGFVDRLLAGVPLVQSLARVVQAEAALRLAPDPVRRLGALAAFLPEDAERLGQKLRLFNVERERLVLMADHWWALSAGLTESQARALLYRLGATHYQDRVLLAWSRSREDAADPAWQALATLPGRWPVPRFPLVSGDFIARGVAKGPGLGEAMRTAETAWIQEGFPSDKTALDAIADRAAGTPQVL